ncbi:MAG TPA: response regulator [Stellaceae bacterium]|jgi:DNA-binding response OmpR family regulator
MLRRLPSVLVVDDDDDVRETIVALLEQAGFRVASASSGWDALDLIDQRDFDLAVVDVGLPEDLTGVDLVRCIRAKRPQQRCLFISGFSDPIADDPERDDFVRKPFRLAELLGCAWELLQRNVSETPADLPHRRERWLIQAARVDCLRRERKRARNAHAVVQPG